MEQLKKCPFCGGEAKWGNVLHNYIECKECGFETIWYETEAEAIKIWNTRKPKDRIVERLEELYAWNDSKKKEAYGEADWEDFARYTERNTGVFIAIEIVKKEGGL
jgi:Lar family restriction alleviation protein